MVGAGVVVVVGGGRGDVVVAAVAMGGGRMVGSRMAIQKDGAPHRVAVTMTPQMMEGMSISKSTNASKTAIWGVAFSGTGDDENKCVGVYEDPSDGNHDDERAALLIFETVTTQTEGITLLGKEHEPSHNHLPYVISLSAYH